MFITYVPSDSKMEDDLPFFEDEEIRLNVLPLIHDVANEPPLEILEDIVVLCCGKNGFDY